MTQQQQAHNVEATLSSLGISDEQLTRNFAARLREKIMKITSLPWPAYICELEKDEELCELLLLLLTHLKWPTMTTINDCPPVRTIASVITSFVTGNPMAILANLSVYFNGMTRSWEIIDVLKKEGLGIGYNSVLMLRNFWALKT